MSEEVTKMSQSLQNCQNTLDIAFEFLGNFVKHAVHEKGEKKEDLLTIIKNSAEKLEKFSGMLAEETNNNPPKKRPLETSKQVPDKKLKPSPSPLMELPNEIWMKILSFLPTYDILKNFNLTCKHFHSLATNPCAIESLQLKLENAKDSSQYQEIVKVLKRSKTLKKFIINGNGRMNHVLAHALKSSHLKTLQVSSHRNHEATLSKRNLECIKNSKIEVLKVEDIILDNYAMQQIGAVKTLKSVRISLYGYRQNAYSCVSELLKTLIDAKIELEDLTIVAGSGFEIYPSVFSKFLEERAENLKKLKICCSMDDTTKKNDRKWEKFSTKWNATSNLEELYYDDYGSQNGQCPIEFGMEMPKLTKLVLRNINGNMLQIFGAQNFPVLERLYLHQKSGSGNTSQQTIFNILENCPNLKSVRVNDNFEDSDLYRFIRNMYKTFNVFIDIGSYHNWSIEKYFKTDLVMFDKYTKIKNDYLDWKKDQPKDEWWW